MWHMGGVQFNTNTSRIFRHLTRRSDHDITHFQDAMREFALHGRDNLFIIQSPSGPQDKPDRRGVHSCRPTAPCLAAFLAAAKPYMYIYCQWDEGVDLLTETTFPEMNYLLGEPESDAIEVETDVWRRRFGRGNVNMTVVFWDNIRKTGNISWADVPPPPPPPPGLWCDPTTFRNNTAYADGPGLGYVPAASATACCAKCLAAKRKAACGSHSIWSLASAT
jgi:hypothetical protein